MCYYARDFHCHPRDFGRLYTNISLLLLSLTYKTAAVTEITTRLVCTTGNSSGGVRERRDLPPARGNRFSPNRRFWSEKKAFTSDITHCLESRNRRVLLSHIRPTRVMCYTMWSCKKKNHNNNNKKIFMYL